MLAYLEAEFRFEDAVQSFAVGASVRIVYAIVRTHDVATTRMDSILEGPSRQSALAPYMNTAPEKHDLP